MEILKEITEQGNGYRLLQKQNRLRLIVEPISDIREAYQKLEVLYSNTEIVGPIDK